MSKILSVTTNSSPKISYTVDVSQISRTPTTCTVRYTVKGWVASSAGYLYTGHKINVTVHGVTRELKSSTAKWTAGKGNAIDIDVTFNASAGTTTVSGVKFSAVNTYGNAGDLSSTACSAYGIKSATASFGSISISANVASQAKATATVSGMPNVGYTTSIKWYLGNTLLSTVSRSAGTTITSYSYVYTGLEPNTTYELKAVIYGVDTAMVTKTVSITSPQETGTLSLVAKSTYITATVGDMFDSPNYDRTVEFYRKKPDSEYILFDSLKSMKTSVSMNITGLISNVEYDVKAIIKNGATVLKTLTGKAATLQDSSLIPRPEIENITQRLGTRKCMITWLADKTVAGTIYKIQAKASDDTDWVLLDTLKSISSPVAVTAHVGNENVNFRIVASNESVAAGTTNTSETYKFYVRDDFVWDSDKTSGLPLVITANEWNRLRDYAITRCKDAGKTVTIPTVKKGDAITASAYNTMKKSINIVSTINIADKRSGDAITAADIDALRIAINNVS